MGLQVDVKENRSYISWWIDHFSSIKDDKSLFSDIFTVQGNKWQFLIHPKGGRHLDHLSIYLVVPNSDTLPSRWSRYVEFGVAVLGSFDGSCTRKVACMEFNASGVGWGFPSFIALSELHNPKRGYLNHLDDDDTCVFSCYISHELFVKTGSDKHKNDEAGCVKVIIVNQETSITKPIESVAPPSSQPSCQIVDIEPIEPKEATEEDMNTFFTGLEAELSSCKIVFSHEDSKEALSKLDEALNMNPANLYDSGNFSQLKHVFKILASFDDSSAILTIEQKNELLAMEERLKEQADRAAKAVHDKNRLTTKESTKLTINLNRNLIRYKEVVSDVKQVELKLASLLAEQRGIFKSSKEMKMELEALGNEWPDYETKAKVAEEEEKIVEAEWGRMKDFISSMKEKF